MFMIFLLLIGIGFLLIIGVFMIELIIDTTRNQALSEYTDKIEPKTDKNDKTDKDLQNKRQSKQSKNS